MYKRAIAICASGIALAAVAQAAPRTYESWSVSAALKQPTGVAGSATVTPGLGVTPFTGASATYTITAQPGYDIRSVIVDGRTVALAAGEKDLKTVTFDNTRLLHTLVANTVAEKYSVSTSVSPARKGAFSPASMKNIAYGTAKTIKVIPMKGWSIASVTDNGGAVQNAVNNPDGTMTISFQNTVGPHVLAATFSQIHAVNAIISPVGDRTFNVDKGDVKFELDAFRSTSNVKPVTYTWALTGAADASFAKLSSTNTGKTLFTASKPGAYTVTLTVNDGTLTSTKQVVFTAQSAKLSQSAACITCHKDSVDKNNTTPVVQEFIARQHGGDTGPGCQTCHGNHSTGKIDPKAGCASCHTTANAALAAQHQANGVSCGSCHDGHSTAGVVASCKSCHETSTAQISVDWKNGHHGSASGHTTGTCQRCHATEGAIVGAAKGLTGSYTGVISPNATAMMAGTTSTNGVTCAACHDEHTGNLRAINTYTGGAVVAWDPNQNGSVDQYDVCTSCHTLTDNTGALTDMYHEKSSINVTRMVADSHYDNPATGFGLASNAIEGYVVRKGSANACADCHNLHTADLTVQEAWAKSAHAGKIATKKDDAAKAQSLIWYNTNYDPDQASSDATVTIGTSTRTIFEHFQRNAAGVAFYKTTGALDDADGNAWVHYNWDQTTSRGACQRCHTSTGIANYLSNPAGYDATGNGNDFSHLAGWTKATGSGQNELLYCWGCHSDSQSGALRNPGAITEVYAGSPTATDSVTVSYPNVDKSNVCMGCHLGRETGAVVKASTGDFTNLSFINSHYLAAGATIFNESGYEFDGQSYDSLGYHKNVGVANANNSGTAGPCVTCHMSGTEKHAFEVSAATPACANCHSGLTTAILDASKHEFHLAMEELRLALKAKGIYFWPAHPYFFKVEVTAANAATTAVSANAFKNWDAVYPGKGKDVMGAAFNYNLLEHDPGAFAHNKQYALKLIQDSIDFLADGAVDGQGITAAFTAAATNKEFAEATSHPAAVVAAASEMNCASCHHTSSAPHYGGAFNTGNAQFVANNGTCADCHAAGNTAANGAILVQYAESAHGDPAGAAWKTSASHDWPNATTCRDCHSTTGFTAKVGGTPRSTVVAGAGQTLACDACHVDLAVDGAVRPAPQYVAGYKSQTLSGTTWTLANAAFPNLNAQNNVCVTCHAGRESGESVKALADANMSNVSFKNPHYLGAAGMMYAKLGFNFAGQDDVVPGTTTTYGKSLTANEDGGLLTSTHRKLGTPAINGDSHNPGLFVPGFLDSDGPCVTCHMGDVKDHTWEINQNAITNVCSACHGAEFTDVAGMELFLEEEGIAPFEDAIALAEAKLLEKFNISYTEAYPYFYDNNLTPAGAVKDWTRGGTLSAAEAKKLMGAALNIKLMKADPAAYAHSRTYARRLLYDTIDWLDDKTLNLSTGATAVAADPVKFAKDTTAGGITTESAKYLMKYNRTTLVWDTASERP